MVDRISQRARESGPFSPAFLAAAELIGKRWTGAIVYALAHGHHRFGELEAVVPGLSGRMLSARLKELAHVGVVRRDVHPDTPPRVEYHLTAMGEELRPVFIALNRWSHRWMTTSGEDCESSDVGTVAGPSSRSRARTRSAP